MDINFYVFGLIRPGIETQAFRYCGDSQLDHAIQMINWPAGASVYRILNPDLVQLHPLSHALFSHDHIAPEAEWDIFSSLIIAISVN